MDPRSYLAGAVGAPPPVPPSPSVGYPTNGDPLAPLDPTSPGAYYFYKLGEELRNIIVAAGLTPSDGNLSQLLGALNAGWGMAKNIASPGYLTLPGGLIVQWGTVGISAGGVVTFANPIAWPVGILAGIACESGAHLWGSTVASIFGLSIAQATLATTTIYTRTVSGGTVSPNSATATYILVGR